MSAPISDLLPNVTADVEEGEIVLDAVIIMRIVSTGGEGQPRIVLANTPGLDWIMQVGMLDVARQICTGDITRIDGDEEDDE